jgi:hypothetical protein
MRAKKVNEDIGFERGSDPKKSMRIGKNRNNPFLHIKSIPILHFIEREKSYLPYYTQQTEIIKAAAKLLDVPVEEVRIAIDEVGDPMEYYKHREFMEAFDDSAHENEIEIDDEWWVMKSETGEVYVIESGEGPVNMLGTKY